MQKTEHKKYPISINNLNCTEGKDCYLKLGEINDIIVDLKAGDEFELSLKDASGTLIKFILVKVYQSNEGLQCTNIAFKEKTLLSRSDLGTNLNLNLCKKEDRYELVSINLSK